MSGRIGITFGPDGVSENVERILKGIEVVWLKDLAEEDRPGELEKCDLLLCQFLTSKELTDGEWAALRNVPAVQTVSAGVDQVPMDRLGDDTDLYANVGGWAPPIAEHVLAMALCCSRRLVQQTRDLSDGIFGFMGYGLKTLKEKVALIVGYGGIGRETASVLSRFGMEVQGLGRRRPEDSLLSRGWTMSELKEALGQADLVVLALPLTKETEGLFDDDILTSMKDDAILVNIARAAIVDEGALYRRLKSSPDFFAALDVWWNEPRDGGAFSTDEPLMELPNLVGSSHNSNQTETAPREALEIALENCLRIVDGNGPSGLVRKDEYLR
ncbi:D-isomer specific 2-hydroxyacid dehydrogenase NAD-binding [Dethiosulfovibrio peptidovorans DSM 11002]|uniref:D-isomer specific 2-hydroxyacid dehydrogenase NAD-binding n=1 Tax=Dethiosulfovibrio peptidovorans DSM 11002 TaxID=469381 RepID=D2Z7E6_9BACT|nr:2-hydroxyacid dehydrogenase [Dethiosulfovibrio peptidovorans]EFC91393.1 D-isomer specific 2-hydroxyacid dehydrogenase NAD-binding [Dethiosulfovibrio peptidovorans DSM 11002]